MQLRGKLRKNLLMTWLNHGTALVIGLFLMPYVLRLLGDEQYGTWIFINSIAGYSGLMYLGFGETISRYVASYQARKEWDRLNQVTNVVLAVYTGMGLLALAIAGVLAWLAPALHDWGTLPHEQLRIVIVVLGLNVAVGMCGSAFGGVLMGVQRFDIVRTVAMASAVLRLVLTVTFLRHEWGLVTLSLIFFAATVVENAVCAFYAFREVPTLSLARRHLQWSQLKECYSFSFYSFVDSAAFLMVEASDSIVIGIVLGAEAIVPYYIAQRLTQFISRPLWQIGSVALPRAGQLHAEGRRKELQQLVLSGSGLAFLLVTGLFVGAGFFGGLLIETWVGPGYQESHLLFVILLGTQVMVVPVSVARSVLFGMGCVRGPALLYLLEAVCNLGLSLLLIGPFGLLGVALGTAIPVIVIEAGLVIPLVLRELEMDATQILRGVIVPFALPVMGLFAYSAGVSQWAAGPGWGALFGIALGGGAVLGVLWLLQRKFAVMPPVSLSS